VVAHQPQLHPVTGGGTVLLDARQLADVAQLAPGRLTFGVGIGGEDPHELQVCGVDPATRGRRMDECVQVVRDLLRGEHVDHAGEFFHLEAARIVPGPAPPIPMVVGGRSDAAIARAGRLGDGWFGIWVSASRYGQAIAQMQEAAAAAGRPAPAWRNALNVWCGVGRGADAEVEAAGEIGELMLAAVA
jgi:alkanesulfonate monooxygenase SsuD/methylene tetrahydromethanopterin reductase-like flavin-dependent oxidoreductase (luciferase family)